MTEETNEVEAEVVEADETYHIEEYDPLQAGMAKRQTVLAVENIPDTSTDEGYALVKQNIKDQKDLIKKVEEQRKALRQPWREYGEAIQEQAADITDELQEQIQPWIDAKKEIDDKKKAEAEERKLAKQKRVNDIKCRIDVITKTVELSVGKSADEIHAIIEEIDDIDCEDGTFEEFTEDAVYEQQVALEKLKSMYDKQLSFEEEKARVKAQQEKMDKEREEREERQRKEDAEREERQRKEDAERAARQAKEDAEREERRKKEEQERADRDAKLKSEEEKLAAQRAEMEAENKRLREAEEKRLAEQKAKEEAEAKKKAEEEKAAKEKAKREADEKRNKKMRDAAITSITSILENNPRPEYLVKMIEENKVSNVKCDWKVK